MRRFVWADLDAQERSAALARPAQRSERSLVARVRSIVDDVRERGWEALAQQARVIDGADPQLVPIRAGAAAARRNLSADQLAALELGARNLRAFHEAQVPAETSVETFPGLIVRKVWRPIDRVGLYVPGGATPLFSTLLHLAIPARSAGVRELVVVTPPSSSLPDRLSPTVALAAELCGIDAVWTVGGAQAIAALAFGAGDIPRVAKICGPGNAWVAEAKTYVASLPGGPAIDMPAGPSELMVIADESATPASVAADLLSQAEHDRAAQVLLVTTSSDVADEVEQEVRRQVATLPRRDIAQAALGSAGLILAPSLEEAVKIANAYAPEHLCLALDDPAPVVARITNAGAVFAGHAAAETFGDYLAGSSHVLPTDGAARAWSGINVHSFLKAMTVQEVTPAAGRALSEPAAILARLEGLEAHARAADARASKETSALAEPVEASTFPSDPEEPGVPEPNLRRAGVGAAL